jgi:hypothetical protein
MFIALVAMAVFLFAMSFPDSVNAIGADTAEDITVRNKLSRLGGIVTNTDLVIVLRTGDVTAAQARWLDHNENTIRREAAERFAKAGLSITFLRYEQVDSELRHQLEDSSLLKDARRSGSRGVVRIDFSNELVVFDGSPASARAPWQALEYTRHGRVTILLGHLGQRGSRACGLTCAVVNLMCHGTGHALGFDDPGHSIPYFPFSLAEFTRVWLRGELPDVMMQAQPYDSTPLTFNLNNHRNRLTIDRLHARN